MLPADDIKVALLASAAIDCVLSDFHYLVLGRGRDVLMEGFLGGVLRRGL